MSNVIKVKTGLVSLLLILMYATMPALADDNQGSIIIDEIVEWTTDQDISQNVHITSGGKLTISSSVTFISTSTVTIDEGGELILSDEAEIKSEKRATSLKTLGALDEVNRSKITIPTSIYSGDVNVVINAEIGTSLDGSKVYLENMEPTDMNGMNFSLIIPESEEDTVLGFTGYGQFPIIKTIVIETDIGDFEYKANELPYQNMLLHGENDLTIDCAGKLEIKENSSILGVNVISSGEITIKEGSITDSSPMILTSNDASFIIQNSKLSGSKEDHYVQAQPFTNIDWGDTENNTQVSIKGDLIDRWERIISNQEIIFDSVGVQFSITGNGPQELLEINGYSGTDGKALINDIGDYRIIEIGWANGEITTEDGIISIVNYRTAWNTESSGIDNYGPDDIELTWEKEIDLTSNNVPDIEWISLTINESEEVRTGTSQQVSAVLANRGSASANLYFDCDISETEMAADIGGYQNVKIDAGEEIEVFFGWRNSEAGSFGLTCEVLTPTQLVEYESSQAFGGGSIFSQTVIWEENQDESFNMIPILIVVFILMITGGVYFINNLSKNAEKTAEILEKYNISTEEDEEY